MKLIYIFGGSILFILLIIGLVLFDQRNQSALQELRLLTVTPTSTASYQQGVEAGRITGQQDVVNSLIGLYDKQNCASEAQYPDCVSLKIQTQQGIKTFYPDYVK